MSGPLTGVRVVMLAGMGPVPFTGMLFADLGADVVRVVRPVSAAARALGATEGMTEEQDVVNRGVRSVEVDLKDAEATEELRRLVDAADVFVEGYRPGVAERLGLGPSELLGRNPRLVYARLTGYGQDGPLARQAGHDINYVAQSGTLHTMARAGEVPRPPINLLGDYAGGATVATMGVIAALYDAERTGRGQVVDAAMVEGVALLTSKLQGLRAAGSFSDEPGTNWLDSGAPFYDTYRCADGKFLAVGALEADFYDVFLAGLGVDTSDWPAQSDTARWPELRGRIAGILGTRARDEWADVFAGTDACVTPVLTFDEAASDPHNRHRGVFREIGGVLHPAPSPRFSRTPSRTPSAPETARADLENLCTEWSPASVSSTCETARLS
ncbi:MAG: CaiB/BaiF CoA-transferase family protein [Tetrasphaera sp.]